MELQLYTEPDTIENEGYNYQYTVELYLHPSSSCGPGTKFQSFFPAQARRAPLVIVILQTEIFKNTPTSKAAGC